jgi:hypothetical protein
MQEYQHHRPTAADRLCRPVRRHNPPPAAPDPGGFIFVVIGSSLAVIVVAMAIALLSQ